jgi:chromosome segregation ATPase
MNTGFPNLTGGQEDMEEGFWSSFSNVMMVILKIFLLVMVIMALNNRNLLDDLQHSIQAKETAQEEAKQASHLAQSRLKANASLEEQLAYYQQHAADLETELLRSKSEIEEARIAGSNRKAELTRLQSLNQELADTILISDKTLNELRAKYTGLLVEHERIQSEMAVVRNSTASKDVELSSLRAKVDENDKRLLSLQGDFTELDKKYQKLLKPARSPKSKQVVEVIYQKTGYSIRKPGEASYRSLDRVALESELGALKTFFGNELYVKIIIPDNSGLSYSEGWGFTSNILSRYDYYYQANSDVPSGPAELPSP